MMYKEKSTGIIYQVGNLPGFKVLNKTKAQNNQEMVMYVNPKQPNKIYVKEKKEFSKEFVKLLIGN